MNTTECRQTFRLFLFLKDTSNFAREINVFLPPIVVVFGITVNVIAIFVFFKYKSWMNYCLHYLFTLALCDAGYLIWTSSYWYRYSAERRNWTPKDIIGVHFMVCKMIKFLWLSCWWISNYTIVGFTFERWITVWFPIKVRDIVTLRFRKKVIAAITISGILNAFTVFYTYNTSNNECGIENKITNDGHEVFLISYYFTAMSIIPFVVTLTFNVLIIFGLLKPKGMVGWHKQKRKISCLLLIISSIFIVLAGQNGAMWIWYKHSKTHINYDKCFSHEDKLQFIDLLSFSMGILRLNYCLNFFVYTLQMPSFREKLRSVFCGGPVIGSRQSSTLSRSNSKNLINLASIRSNQSEKKDDNKLHDHHDHEEEEQNNITCRSSMV